MGGGKAQDEVALLNIRQSLLDYDSAMLEAVARSRGIDPDQEREALIEALVSASSGPLTMRLVWDELTVEERRALAYLATKGGWLPAVYFESSFGSARSFGPGRLLRERLWEQPASVTEALLFRGLVFRGFSPDRRFDIWYIPPDLLEALPAAEFTPLAKAETPSPLDAEARTTLPAGDYLARAVYHAVAAARLGERPLAGALLRRMAAEPGAPDEERIEHMGALALAVARSLGFLDKDRIRDESLSRITAWLKAPRGAALRAAARAWMACEEWHELLHAPGLIYDGGRLPSAAPARQALLEALRQLETGRWYAVFDLQTWLRHSQPDFLRRDSDFTGLYMRAEAGGETLDGIGAWMQIEGRFLEEVLVALNGLGAVSLGTAGEARALRVEPKAWWREPAAPDRQARRRPLTLRPGLTLHLSEGAPFMVRYQLESVAEAAGTSTYRITRGTVRRAQARGVALESIARFLAKSAAGFGEPEHKALQALAGPPSVQARPGMVLEPEDEDAFRSLLADPGFRLCLDTELPGGRLLVRHDRWPAAEARLRALGVDLRSSEE